MIKAYWLRLLLFAAGGAVIALGLSMLAPKKYEAVVELLIDQKPMTPNVAMTSADQAVNDLLDFNRSRSLATQVQQLVSLGVIGTAAQKVAELKNMQGEFTKSDGMLFPTVVQDNVSISAEQQSDIIQLRVRMTDPQIAVDLAREIRLAFEAQGTSASRELAQRAIETLEKQSTDIDRQLADVDSKVRTWRDQVGPDVNVMIQAEIQQLGELRNLRDQAAIEAAASQRLVESLRQELARTAPKLKASQTSGPDPMYQRLSGDVSAAQITLKNLRARYTDERPEVKAAKENLAMLQAELNKYKRYDPNQTSTEAPNPLYQQLQGRLAESEASSKASQQRAIDAQQVVNQKEAGLKRFPAAQTELSQLARQQNALERLYLTFQDKLKALKTAEQGRVAPIKEVTPAQLISPDPVSPKVTINTLFGLVAGLILGVLSMLATEAKRQPVRSLAQLNGLALKPVYRLIPELRAPFRGLTKAPPESFESLLANFLRSPKRPYRIAVVGVNKDSGASTAAINLAIAGAKHGSRVLMVQCDPRGGLARLAGKQPPTEGVMEISPLLKGMTTESVLGVSGEIAGGVSNEVASHEADLTVIDLEPTTRSAEYAFVAPHVDEVILMVRAGRARSVEFLQAQQALRDAGCPVVTVAFTRSSDLAVTTDTVEEAAQPAPKPLDA